MISCILQSLTVWTDKFEWLSLLKGFSDSHLVDGSDAEHVVPTAEQAWDCVLLNSWGNLIVKVSPYIKFEMTIVQSKCLDYDPFFFYLQIRWILVNLTNYKK